MSLGGFLALRPGETTTIDDSDGWRGPRHAPFLVLRPESATTARSFFDNIPPTELASKQGGHDWGVLAYAVGFGGSMQWFDSSASVALSNLFPEARSVGQWLKEG